MNNKNSFAPTFYLSKKKKEKKINSVKYTF